MVATWTSLDATLSLARSWTWWLPIMFACCLSYSMATLLAILYQKLFPSSLTPQFWYLTSPLILSVWGCLWWWVLMGLPVGYLLIPRWSLSCATTLRYSSLADLLFMSWFLFRFRQTPLLKQTMWKKHSESLLYVTRNLTWMIRKVRPWYLFCSLICNYCCYILYLIMQIMIFKIIFFQTF